MALVKRESAVKRLIDQQSACHGIAHNMEFPIVFVPVAGRAAENTGFGFIVTAQRAHEIRRAINDLVSVQIQLKWILPVLGNLKQYVLVLAWRVRDCTFGVTLPRPNDVFVTSGERQARKTDEKSNNPCAAHEMPRMISEAGAANQRESSSRDRGRGLCPTE